MRLVGTAYLPLCASGPKPEGGAVQTATATSVSQQVCIVILVDILWLGVFSQQ